MTAYRECKKLTGTEHGTASRDADTDHPVTMAGELLAARCNQLGLRACWRR